MVSDGNERLRRLYFAKIGITYDHVDKLFQRDVW